MKCRFIVSLAIVALLTACASAPPSSPVAPGAENAKPVAAAPAQTLKQFTHADLLAAAKYAEDHGFPARAGMWKAIEYQLTAAENQVAACKAAIAASVPSRQLDGTVGLATLIEMGAEAVATGIPASVKANCEPIVLPAGLLPLPKLP